MIKGLKYILIILFSFLLVGCRDKTYKVGIIIYEENDTFMNEFVSQIKNKELKNIEFEVLYSMSSQSMQNQQIITLLNKKIDLLVINPVDRMAAKTIVEKTNETNTPIIFINRQPQKSDLDERDNIYYVGADPKSQGMLQAEIAKLFLGDPNNINYKYDFNNDNIVQVVILKGESGHQDSEDRTQESIKHLKALGYEVEVLQTKLANWQREEAKQAMKELEEKFPEKIELILSNNDDMALGAIDYYLNEFSGNIFSENYLYPKIIVGVDKTLPAIEAINNNYLNGTVLNDSMKQADAVSELILILLGLNDLNSLSYNLIDEKYVLIPGEIYLK